MPQIPTDSPSFERDARQIATALERYRYFILAFLTLLYAFGAVRHAAQKALWFDEICTVIASSSPDAATTWKAAQATDVSPPLPHLLIHFAMQWFGSSEVAIRLPSMLGFWVFCLCLFQFVGRRSGIFFAFAALLMPIATEAYTYSYEARAYGPELGFCGLMIVAWQMATEERRRLWGCLLLALGMGCALLCQYYAVLLYLPLGGAELYRSWRMRRWNWGIWTALVCGAIPLVWHFAAIRHVITNFSKTTWSPAYPEQIVEFWETMLQHSLSFAVLGLAVLALTLIGNRPPEEETAPPKLAPHEILLGVLFLGIPVAAIAIGIFKTHMFTPRYALIGVTGVLLLVPMIASRLAKGRAFTGFLVMCLSAVPLVFVMVVVPDRDDPVVREATLITALEQGPVVIPDGQLYMQMWYYAPAPLKSNLLYLADSEAAIRYMGFDVIDVGIVGFKPWSSVAVADYQDFAKPGREFRLYQSTLRPGWVLAKVVADGASTQIERYTTLRQLIRVRLKD